MQLLGTRRRTPAYHCRAPLDLPVVGNLFLLEKSLFRREIPYHNFFQNSKSDTNLRQRAESPKNTPKHPQTPPKRVNPPQPPNHQVIVTWSHTVTRLVHSNSHCVFLGLWGVWGLFRVFWGCVGIFCIWSCGRHSGYLRCAFHRTKVTRLAHGSGGLEHSAITRLSSSTSTRPDFEIWQAQTTFFATLICSHACFPRKSDFFPPFLWLFSRWIATYPFFHFFGLRRCKSEKNVDCEEVWVVAIQHIDRIAGP